MKCTRSLCWIYCVRGYCLISGCLQDLGAVSHALLMPSDKRGSAVLESDLAARCKPVMTRGNDVLRRVQDVGSVFTTQLKECSQRLSEIRARSASHDESSSTIEKQQCSAQDGSSSRVEVVQQVLLRKVLAVDRGQAATVSNWCLRTHHLNASNAEF